MAIYHHTTRMIGRSNGGNPVKALAYISGVQLADGQTGEIYDFKEKSVEEVQILLPENAPQWAKDIQKLVLEDPEKGLQLLSDMANKAEKRSDAQVYREIEFSLPRELTYEQNKQLATEYVQDQFCQRGMLAIQSFHVEKCDKTGELNPHCHTFFLTRELVEGGLATKKTREWNERSLHGEWREQWAQYANFHLKMHGYDITLDHRSYEDQGLDIEPQIKLGKGVKEQEKRAQGKERAAKTKHLGGDGIEEGKALDHPKAFFSQAQGLVEKKPTINRVQALREVQLRNLYRILRRPEVVLDIVTRHHATFMWGDVQKILGRYVDDGELFQRVDARLRNSKELLLLRMEGVKDGEGRIEERAIYTTRSMLKAERALVSTAESLAAHHSHGVSSSSLESGLGRMQAQLQEKGYRLSEGQETAIRHLVGEGQLKCIVGYAGAGKTTALEACREIWEAEGYRVYGLAPTGRAAQNLEGSGIASQTLHKFLKSFEEGRSQYSDKSILVLDEAGMVDVERFEGFLGAVQTLGVKAVVVGDAAQLQPVEAGPAFRLVTERVKTSRLEEVVRQKEEWQREATVLFGKQDSKSAIQAYQERGHIHLIEEKGPEGHHSPLEFPESLEERGKTHENVVKQYEIAARTSGLIFREIIKDVQTQHPEKMNPPLHIRNHEDYREFLKWKDIQKNAGKEILGNAEVYKPFLEERHLDPLQMARLFVSKKQSKSSQYKEAVEILRVKGLNHLIGKKHTLNHSSKQSFGQSIEVRSSAKAALIEDWKRAYYEDPHKSLLIMAYSNKDVRDLNSQARNHLKASGHLGKAEFTYTITREIEDDFGRRKKIKEERQFAKGDRIVLTQNNGGLGVKNGSLGEIVALNKNLLEVKLDEGKTLSFSPNLFSFFDQGWAVTIHKSQGTTVDKSFLLASHEMSQNLTYVAMTRHREDVQVYGSACDFWRAEKVPDILSKSGEKLGAADYLDSHSLEKLMKDEDRFLSRLFRRLGDELYAMGAVSKHAFNTVVDHFLGRTLERDRGHDILLDPEVIREEDRAQDILWRLSTHGTEKKSEHDKEYSSQKENLEGRESEVNPALLKVYEDMNHPAFKQATHFKRVFEEGLKLYGEEGAIQYWQSKRETFVKLYEQKLERVEKELQSPFLSYMSDESRALTRKAALGDPDKTLEFLAQVKESKKVEQEEKIKATQMQESSLREHSLPGKDQNLSLHKPQEPSLSLEEKNRAVSAYVRFKELRMELEKDPYDRDCRKELKKISNYFLKDKAAFEHVKTLDPEIEKSILKVAQEKIYTLERSRGGLSL